MENARKLSFDTSSKQSSPSWRRRSRPLEIDESDTVRKRIRAEEHLSSIDDISTTVRVQKTQQLHVNDDEKIAAFYATRFMDLQQNACRILAKAWVKLVEPKKQTHHPYRGKEEKRPNWWPTTSGETTVPHKEPDHLHKARSASPDQTAMRLLMMLSKGRIAGPHPETCG